MMVSKQTPTLPAGLSEEEKEDADQSIKKRSVEIVEQLETEALNLEGFSRNALQERANLIAKSLSGKIMLDCIAFEA